MKCLAVFLLGIVPAFAVDESVCAPFEAAVRSGSEIRMDLRSGDIDITGTDAEAIRVECDSRSHDASGIRVAFENGRLKVHGGPKGDVRIRIQVPKQSHLVVRCSAGDLDITGVQGNKDVSLRAGDLTIDVGRAADYASAEASVKAGDIQASAFGVHKGGLFRSFEHRNTAGRYSLRARLLAGDIKLK